MTDQAVETAVLREKVDGVARDVIEVKDTVREVSAALRALVAVEQRQLSQQEVINDTRTRLDEHESRIGRVEHQMPSLVEMRLWIIGGFGALALAFCVAVFSGNVGITLGKNQVISTTAR